MYLQDGHGQLTIRDRKGAVFSCLSSEFPAYEPEYQALADGIALRYWCADVQYINDGSQRGDPFYSWPRFEAFCSRIAQYQAAYDAAHPAAVVVYPKIYVALNITGGDNKDAPAMYPNETTASLKSLAINGRLLSDPDNAQSIIPVTYTWRVSVYRVHREKFARDTAYTPILQGSYPLRIQITSGIIAMPAYSYKKEGVYMIDDDALDLIDGAEFGLPGQYEIQIIGGAKFFKVIE